MVLILREHIGSRVSSEQLFPGQLLEQLKQRKRAYNVQTPQKFDSKT